jgi:hypothetical protein
MPTFICGLARNAGAGLLPTLQKIGIMKQSIEDHVIVIATNDNVDGTDKILSDWASTDKRHTLLKLDGLSSLQPERLTRLAFLRNLCLQELWSRGAEFRFVMVIDLDGPNNNISPEIIVNLINQTSDGWDALFANQRECYYDLYALRHSKWCPTDCWMEVTRATRFPFRTRRRDRAVKIFVYNRQFHIPYYHPPIAVKSAFGGLGIYKIEALKGCEYGSTDAGGQAVCEHVVLHEQMHGRGARLFIEPSLLNNAPREHLGPSSGRPLPVDFFPEPPSANPMTNS